MSVCIRTISNKLSLPFVGTVKTVSPVDRQLTKNVKKTTAFLEEFFSAGSTIKSETRESATAASLYLVRPLEATSDNVVAWNYRLRTSRNWSIGNEKERFKDITRRPLHEASKNDGSRTIFSVPNKEQAVSSPEKSSLEPGGDNALGKPTQDQLNHVYEVLHTDLPEFFIKPVNYSIYHPNIVFENNIRGTVTKGLYEYIKQTGMLRIIGHLKFAYVKFEVLKMTVHPEDDSVKVRWRIRGMTGMKVFLFFWRYKLWKIKAAIDSLDSWHDGFSTFYVGSEGKVIKHVADKMMPDQDTEVTKDKTAMAAKLALFLGLVTPREFLADISPLMFCGTELEPSGDATRRKTPDSSLEPH